MVNLSNGNVLFSRGLKGNLKVTDGFMHPQRSNHLSVTLGEKVNEFGGKIKEKQIIM